MKSSLPEVDWVNIRQQQTPLPPEKKFTWTPGGTAGCGRPPHCQAAKERNPMGTAGLQGLLQVLCSTANSEIGGQGA